MANAPSTLCSCGIFIHQPAKAGAEDDGYVRAHGENFAGKFSAGQLKHLLAGDGKVVDRGASLRSVRDSVPLHFATTW